MTEEMSKSPVGAQSAMRTIFEYVAGEPYAIDELSAKADPERYTWETEQADWALTHEPPAEI